VGAGIDGAPAAAWRQTRRAARRAARPYRKPVQQHNREAFAAVARWLADSSRPLAFDSGCGTGQSTLALGAAHPTWRLVGIDKSAVRLARYGANHRPAVYGNVMLVRADLVDFWRLAATAGWRLAAHWLLYPNPWPKPSQAKRRWAEHPVWPALLALGGQLELRCDRFEYAQEMAWALRLAGPYEIRIDLWQPPVPISPFEGKYLHQQRRLYRLVAALAGC